MPASSHRAARALPVVLGLALLAGPVLSPGGGAAGQNDAGSGGDAGDSFETATPIGLAALHRGFLDAWGGDTHDYYRFALIAGEPLTVHVDVGFATTQPITLLDPHGVVLDAAANVFGFFDDSTPAPLTLEVAAAPASGEYRIHLSGGWPVGDYRYAYSLCFVPCAAEGGQNDAGTGADAADAFADATPIAAAGRADGRLHREAGDADDYYRFPLARGQAFEAEVVVDAPTTGVVSLLDPHGVVLAATQRIEGGLTGPYPMRLRVASAPVDGDYRIHLSARDAGPAAWAYSLCLEPCGSPGWQNDAGSGGDAGNSLGEATRVTPSGLHWGRLSGNGADDDDHYKFFVPQGGSVNVDIRGGIHTGTLATGPADNMRRLSFQLLDPNGVLLDTPNTNQGDARVTLAAAPVAGDYVLRVTSEFGFLGSYGFCFVPPTCEEPGLRVIDFTMGGSLPHTTTRVLLVPPPHGDLGNPLGPTVLDYLDATVRGIREWEYAIDRFATDYPQFAYLRELDIEIEIFDDASPVDPAGYDMLVLFVESSGPFFRGFAGGSVDLQYLFDRYGLGDAAHFSGRHAVLSLFASSPRAGQVLPDYPEVNDIHAVTMHESAHVFGLGHTNTWTAAHGPDLMVSPAPFIFGDNNPVGDGGERTSAKCISTLDLYGLAVLYRWVPSGNWVGTGGSVGLPWWMPYKWYC